MQRHRRVRREDVEELAVDEVEAVLLRGQREEHQAAGHAPVDAERHRRRDRRGLFLARAHAVEQFLGRMRQRGQLVELQAGRASLQRVRGAEDLVQQLRVVRLLLEAQQQLLE